MSYFWIDKSVKASLSRRTFVISIRLCVYGMTAVRAMIILYEVSSA